MKIYIGPYPKDEKERKIRIRIDKYDTWNMDHTLALLIVPMLKQLKATKHGIPCEMLSDFHNDQYRQYAFDFIDYDVDFEAGCKNWDKVMDDMIWSFEQLAKDDDTEIYEMSKSDYNKYQERVDYGLELFGKYFRNLWD